MALGNIDINTMERIDDFSPDSPRPQVDFLQRMLVPVQRNKILAFNFTLGNIFLGVQSSQQQLEQLPVCSRSQHLEQELQARFHCSSLP